MFYKVVWLSVPAPQPVQAKPVEVVVKPVEVVVKPVEVIAKPADPVKAANPVKAPVTAEDIKGWCKPALGGRDIAYMIGSCHCARSASS